MMHLVQLFFCINSANIFRVKSKGLLGMVYQTKITPSRGSKVQSINQLKIQCNNVIITK